MKKSIAFIFTAISLFLAGCSKAPSQPTESSPSSVSATTNSTASLAKPQDAIIPTGKINLINVDLSQFLQIYSALAGAQLDTSQLGSPLPSILIHFTNTNAVTRSEAIILFDKALYDQAGIVATHTDKTHVVFNHRS